MISRRGLLVAGVVVLTSARTVAADKVCADPTKLDDGQKSLRNSLNYVEQSPDPSKTCSGCSFFQAAGDGCGACQIFSGPANDNGHCDSWGAKG
jgi:hypothetical protein